MIKRQKKTPGSILEICINNEYYVYAQILPTGQCAFFDYRTPTPIKDLKILLDCNVLFFAGVFNDIITSAVWLKVGKLPIRKDLEKTPNSYIYDRVGRYFLLYDHETGEMYRTTKDKCRGLESCTVYDFLYIEERIFEYYNGHKPAWLLIEEFLFELL